MALSPAQTADATKIYTVAVQKGLPPQRARELVLAAFHEGGLDPNAHNPSGAEGDMQLLSPGYQAKAKALGGVHNTYANVSAILPDYQRYWQQHPDAPMGAAAAAVERSGEGAGYYSSNADLMNFLGSAGGKPPPVGPAPMMGAPAQGPTRDARTEFALAMAQSIGSHHFDPHAISSALSQLNSSEQPSPDARGIPRSPFEAISAAAHNASGAGGMVGQVAARYLGVPYKWGGASAKGMDCSGFLQNVMGDLGVKLPRTTYDQVKHGQPVDLHQLQPGDAIFTEPGHAGPNHVGLYVGHGMVQESPHTGDVNKLIPLDSFLSGGFVAARRYLGG